MTFQDVMKKKVEEYWGLIRQLGYENAPLVDQYNLIVSYEMMMED